MMLWLLLALLANQAYSDWRHKKRIERLRDQELIYKAMDQLTDEELAERLR